MSVTVAILLIVLVLMPLASRLIAWRNAIKMYNLVPMRWASLNEIHSKIVEAKIPQTLFFLAIPLTLESLRNSIQNEYCRFIIVHRAPWHIILHSGVDLQLLNVRDDGWYNLHDELDEICRKAVKNLEDCGSSEAGKEEISRYIEEKKKNYSQDQMARRLSFRRNYIIKPRKKMRFYAPVVTPSTINHLEITP